MKEPLTVAAVLAEATAMLSDAGIGTARLDLLVLLEDITGLDRAKLLAEPDLSISAAQLAKLIKLLNKRARHVPLAYVRGFTEFYGRKFVITPAVLEPRPESETMLDLLLKLKDDATRGQNRLDSSLRWDDKTYIADVGTGSGALGITAKFLLPSCNIELIELDAGAGKVAQRNVDLFTLPVPVIKSNLLAAVSQKYHVLLCNLPYVPDDYHINQAAAQEPRLAIFGGPDGLDVYRKLFDQLKIVDQNPLYILTESLPPQHTGLRGIAGDHGYRQIDEQDFIQVFARQL